MYERTLAQTRAQRRARESLEMIGLLPAAPGFRDHDFIGRYLFHYSGSTGPDAGADICGNPLLATGAHERGFGSHQRYRLFLHVRSHECPVRIVVSEKGDKAGRRPECLRRVQRN